MAMMVKIRATSTGGDMKGYGPTTGTSDHVTGTYKGGFNWDTWPTPSNALQTGSIDTSQYCALPTTNGYRWHGETFGFAGSEAKIHDPSNNLGFNLDGHDYTKIKHSGVPNQDNISGSNTDYDYGDDVVCSIAVRVYAQAVSGGGGDDGYISFLGFQKNTSNSHAYYWNSSETNFAVESSGSPENNNYMTYQDCAQGLNYSNFGWSTINTPYIPHQSDSFYTGDGAMARWYPNLADYYHNHASGPFATWQQKHIERHCVYGGTYMDGLGGGYYVRLNDIIAANSGFRINLFHGSDTGKTRGYNIAAIELVIGLMKYSNNAHANNTVSLSSTPTGSVKLRLGNVTDNPKNTSTKNEKSIWQTLGRETDQGIYNDTPMILPWWFQDPFLSEYSIPNVYVYNPPGGLASDGPYYYNFPAGPGWWLRDGYQGGADGSWGIKVQSHVEGGGIQSFPKKTQAGVRDAGYTISDTGVHGFSIDTARRAIAADGLYTETSDVYGIAFSCNNWGRGITTANTTSHGGFGDTNDGQKKTHYQDFLGMQLNISSSWTQF